MILWEQSIAILRESIFAYSQLCNGNVGYGILIVTFLARLALVPLGIRLARAAQLHQRALESMQPELDRLRSRHKGNPRRLAEETRRLMARAGVSVVPLGSCLGAVIQIPIFVGLYSAVRDAATVGGRLWWIRDIARPDWSVAIVGTLLTVLATAAGAGGTNRTAVLIASGFATAVALSSMASGVGLYWGLSSLFGAVQGFAIQRTFARPAA